MFVRCSLSMGSLNQTCRLETFLDNFQPGATENYLDWFCNPLNIQDDSKNSIRVLVTQSVMKKCDWLCTVTQENLWVATNL